MLKDENAHLHDIIRILIDTEMAIINGRYEKAYYLLGKLKIGMLDEFFFNMRNKVRHKLYDIQGENT